MLDRSIWNADQQSGVPPAARGYKPRKDLALLIKNASQPDLRRGLTAIAKDHAVILFVGIASYLSLQVSNAWVPILVLPLTMLIAGRTARGLECIVHEASHYNLTRNRRLNDILADILCAWPVLSQVAQYRKSHMVHHRAFGHATDPDRIRHEKLGLISLDRSNPLKFTLGIAARLVPYVPGWWWAIGVDIATVVYFLAWHSVVFLLPASLALGIGEALTLWSVTWGFPVFFVLPVVRFIAEAAEHDYENHGGDTQVIFKTTWSNVGWIHHWLFHPHNDGFHAVHHLYPSVPHHALAEVHALVMQEDPRFAEDALIRMRLLSIGPKR